MNTQQVRDFVIAAEKAFSDNLDMLTKMDSLLGDGDHGVSMLTGFKGAKKLVEEGSFSTPSEVFQTVGRSLMKEIGGTCGPLFATIFMKGALATKGKETIGTEDFAKMFSDASTAIQSMGRSKPGDKTMVDALAPAAVSLTESAAAGLGEKAALEAAYQAAVQGAEATKDMLATKGRGRYQGEKSLGCQDAGATSVSIILKTFWELA